MKNFHFRFGQVQVQNAHLHVQSLLHVLSLAVGAGGADLAQLRRRHRGHVHGGGAVASGVFKQSLRQPLHATGNDRPVVPSDSRDDGRDSNDTN